MKATHIVAVAALVAGAAVPAHAQSTDPKPWARVSFFTNTAQTTGAGLPTRNFNEITTSVTYSYPDLDNDGLEYGLDMRRSNYFFTPRPSRVAHCS